MTPYGVVIRFAEHVPADEVERLSGQLAELGGLNRNGDREFIVVIERVNSRAALNDILAKWETDGVATNRPLSY